MSDRPHPIPPRVFDTGPYAHPYTQSAGPYVQPAIRYQPPVKPEKSWGDGMWKSIHLTAAWADDPELVAVFCRWVRMNCSHLPCPECSSHAMAYIQAYPPEKAEDVFVWTWRFHNSVNSRLGKPEMDYATARELYFNGKVKLCDGGCGEAKKIEKVKTGFAPRGY
jgi:hypothetical protein